jgi:hypothetical protein
MAKLHDLKSVTMGLFYGGSGCLIGLAAEFRHKCSHLDEPTLPYSANEGEKRKRSAGEGQRSR